MLIDHTVWPLARKVMGWLMMVIGVVDWRQTVFPCCVKT